MTHPEINISRVSFFFKPLRSLHPELNLDLIVQAGFDAMPV